MTVQPQTPAEGILLRKDFGDAKIYQVVCECGDDTHSHDVWVEPDDHNITVTTYTQQKTNWWTHNGLWTRLKLTWQLWIHGYIKYEASIIMSRQQALNYANTLQAAVKDVAAHKQNK